MEYSNLVSVSIHTGLTCVEDLCFHNHRSTAAQTNTRGICESLGGIRSYNVPPSDCTDCVEHDIEIEHFGRGGGSRGLVTMLINRLKVL